MTRLRPEGSMWQGGVHRVCVRGLCSPDSMIAQNLAHTCTRLADTCKHLAELVSKQAQELAVLKAAGAQQHAELATLKAELTHPNSLEHFLADANCSFGTDHRMPREDFMKRYNEYCQLTGMRPKPLISDAFQMVFKRYAIKATDRASHPRGRAYQALKINTVWLQGVDILDEHEEQDETSF